MPADRDTIVELGGAPRDMITVRWAGSAGDDAYIRIGALEEGEATAIMDRFKRAHGEERVIPPAALNLPPMGVTHVLGGSGPAIISMRGGVLSILTTEGTTMGTVTGVVRKHAGISITMKGGVQHVFTFSERPVPAIPDPWGEQFPIGVLTKVGG